LTVTADNQTRLYGQANPTLTQTLTGFVNNETLQTSGVSGLGNGTTAATPDTAIGSAAIVASASGLVSGNYDFASSTSDGTLMIVAIPVSPQLPPTPVPVQGASIQPASAGGPPLIGGMPGPAPVAAAPVRPAETPSTGTAAAPGTQPSSGGNSALTVTVPMGSTVAATGFDFALPAQLVQGKADAAIEVTAVSGAALPSWLRFDPSTKRFLATAVPPGGLPIEVAVTVDGQRALLVIAERAE
jgi:hypothetical protein